jgi:hypothetical protein
MRQAEKRVVDALTWTTPPALPAHLSSGRTRLHGHACCWVQKLTARVSVFQHVDDWYVAPPSHGSMQLHRQQTIATARNMNGTCHVQNLLLFRQEISFTKNDGLLQ